MTERYRLTKHKGIYMIYDNKKKSYLGTVLGKVRHISSWTNKATAVKYISRLPK